MIRLSVIPLMLFALAAAACGQDPWLAVERGEGPGKGKRVVLVSGDEEYRSEEALTQLAQILAKHHGFSCTVLYAIDPKTGEISPNKTDNIPGLEALRKADLMVIATRFRNLPDEQMKEIDDYLRAGRPVIGMRTATHGFNIPRDRAFAHYGNGYAGEKKDWADGFGRSVLGEKWISHHGHHGHESTRGLIAPGAKDHPILRGIHDGDIWGPTDVYGVRLPLPGDSQPLVLGQVLEGMKPDSPVVEGNDAKKNDPMMPVAWVKTYSVDGGPKGRVFTTTMGSSTDLASAGLRRLLVNACYWATGLEGQISPTANVGIVGTFDPSPFGFNGAKKGVKPADLKEQAAGSSAAAEKKPAAAPQQADPWKTAHELLARPARPARPALPPSTLPLAFQDGERIAIYGNSTAERMNLFGHFESLLHQRFPEKKLVVRNFARPADEVGNRQRAGDYTRLDDPVAAFGADTYLLFFGFNESFAGPDGVAKFKQQYETLLDELAKKYPRDDTNAAPRFVIVSPIAVEPTGDPLMPDADAQNKLLAVYRDAARDVAAKRGIAFVDLFDATRQQFTGQPGRQHTINGCHLNEAGDTFVGQLLDRQLFGAPSSHQLGADAFAKLRAAVIDKSWIAMQDHRMVNGWYVYGGRRTFDTETFPREYVKLRNMAAVRDAYVWDIAAGRPVPPVPDDSRTGETIVPPTRFGSPGTAKSENPEGGPVIKSPEDVIKTCTVPEGFEIRLFADEQKFPEIAKPVQLAFDSKGRLWVSTMPSYPQWKPGDPKPADKLVILEDTDGDEKADKSTVFYDKLHCPTGFQFFEGGVLVVDQPRMLWLKDTNGDDKADIVVNVLDGWATEDTHHTTGAFEASPGGLLHMLEGVAMSTAIETPWGPFRNHGSSGAYVLDPRTWKISHFNTPGYGNPWCYVFDEWGQGICGDGTGAAQHWDTPLSGKQYGGRKGMNPVFNTEGMRPVVGSEFLRTRQYPDDVQDQFIYACVINMNGIPRWKFSDDGAGYKGERVRHDVDGKPQPFDLIKSTDKHFRPVDPQIGPDGALWFGDWANPLIGHMQYSQRDPNRDHIHGRIYRLVYKPKPLLAPETQAGKSIEQVLEQLKSPEWRTRYRARADLQARPKAEVLAAANAWLGRVASDPNADRLATEVLWLQQSFHAVEAGLLSRLLESQVPNARAAAVRVLADERDRFPDAESRLIAKAADPIARVRTEAVRGLSFFGTMPAMQAVIASANTEPSDRFIAYTCDAALGANIPVWKKDYEAGTFAAKGTPALAILESVLGLDKKAAEIKPHLDVLLSKDPKSDEERNKAMTGLAGIKGGNVENGKAVFRRVCIACHALGADGANLGPNMAGVGKRLDSYKLVESIIDPNAAVDEKYLSTLVITADGRSIAGLLVSETPEAIVIFDGKEQKRIPVSEIDEKTKLKQSSMPEGLAGTLSPNELLDVVEFLRTLK